MMDFNSKYKFAMTDMKNLLPTKILTNVDALNLEKVLLKKYLNKGLAIYKNDILDCKNIDDSMNFFATASSMLGNGEKIHSEDVHELMLIHINASIACAPKDSNQLVKSILLRIIIICHLKMYEDCMKECQRELKKKNANAGYMAFFSYYLCLCHQKLKKPITKELRSEIIRNLNGCCKEDHPSIRKSINWIKKSLKSNWIEEKKNHAEPEYTRKEYLNFERHEKFACASKSIDVVKKNGNVRIVASKDIEPGEVIVLEKRYGSHFDVFNGILMHCSYCQKQAWIRIPCYHCSSEMYCSEECRSNDWASNHQWICKVIPQNLKQFKYFLKFFFDLVKEAGGLDNFVEYFKEDIKMEESLDQSSDGTIKYFYNLSSSGQIKVFSEFWMDLSFNFAYYLATKSSFLGKKYAKNKNIFEDERVFFLAAAILRSFEIFSKTHLFLNKYYPGKPSNHCQIMGVSPFVRLFRHSCCPNASYFTSKDQETVVYAKYRIKKGSEINICYFPNGTYIDQEISSRSQFINHNFNFHCSCIACKENWNAHQLKTYKILLENEPELLQDVNDQYKSTLNNLQESNKQGNGIPYFYIEKIIDLLKIFNEQNFVHTIEYEILFKYLHLAYIAHYGFRVNDLPITCEKNTTFFNVN